MQFVCKDIAYCRYRQETGIKKKRMSRTHHIRTSATNASPMPRSTRMNTSFIIHNYAVQEATPRAPARAVSTAMRILRICFQSVFILV